MKSFLNWPEHSKEEVDSVSKILKSGKVNYWTGENGKKFESEFSSWCDSKYAIAIANGSLALELAVKSLNIKQGDEVIVTPRSFIASVSAVVNSGAKPIFADIDLDSGNINASTISKVITDKTKAILCVHLAGWPCDMDPIMKLARSKNLYVIEDCAQAHGAVYKGRKVGSIGDIGAWSFCQDKIMTTGGEGGMITTNNKKLWKFVWEYKDHGKNYGKTTTNNPKPGFRWLHDSFGSNYRMTEVQSSIGRSQLKKIDRWTKKRNSNAAVLLRLCRKFPKLVRTPTVSPDTIHAYYKFYTYLQEDGLKSEYTRDTLLEKLNEKGVPAFSGSCSEIYLESAFDKTNYRPKNRLSAARKLGESSIVFLVHPTLSKKDMLRMTDIIQKVFEEVSV